MIQKIALVVLLFIIGCKNDSISKVTMESGKKIYDRNCLGCHMEDAMGVPGLNPPLAGSPLLLDDESRAIKIVLKGSDELKDEPARNYKNIMGSFVSLTDKEIADVLTFTRNSYGNKAPAISDDDVQAVRARLK